MARPRKRGLDYFPQDVNEYNRFEMKLMIARFGASGIALHQCLKASIYENWFFLPFDDEKGEVLADHLKIPLDIYHEILEFMFRKEIFIESIYREYGFLTSKEIQVKWLTASEKRSMIEIIEEIWVIDETLYLNERALKNIVYIDINQEFPGVFSEKTPQSKVKEIKEKKKNIEKKEPNEHKPHKEHGGEAPPYPPLCVDNESGDMKEEKEVPKPKLGKQARKQAEKHRINQQAIEIIDYLNQKTGKKYRHAKAHITVISARLKEGFTLDDCKRVIDTKTAQWLNDEKEKYLRPETLFRPSKFEGYLNEKPPGTFPQKERIVNHMTVSNDYTYEKRIMEMQSRRQQQAQQNNSNAPPQAQQAGG